MSRILESIRRSRTRLGIALGVGAALSALVALVAAPSPAPAQAPIVLKMQSTWPTQDIFHQTFVDWAKKVAVPVLLGKAPGTVVPVAAEVFEMRVNTAAAKAAGITIPADIVKKADKVFDK